MNDLLEGFDSAYDETMRHEGGYANDPHDKGGETYCGISRRWHPSWSGWRIVDACKVKNKANLQALYAEPNLKRLVRSFYRAEFWDKLRGDEIDGLKSAIAKELFDSAINVDPIDAVKFLQTALNMLGEVNGRSLYRALKVDGKIGPATSEALTLCLRSACNADLLILRCMNGEQYIHYKNNPQHKRYRGWFART